MAIDPGTRRALARTYEHHSVFVRTRYGHPNRRPDQYPAIVWPNIGSRINNLAAIDTAAVSISCALLIYAKIQKT